MQFAIRYDLRNPPEWHKPPEKLYAHFLNQVEWADSHGFSRIGLSEHHFSDDEYLPSLFTAAAAVAARTKHIQITLNLVLLPLKHPVQVAEEAALVDIISGGRMQLMLGAGYRRAEFEGYGIPMSSRPGRMEEGIQIIRKCWEEEEFDFHGKYWSLKNVRCTPKPVQKPRPQILMGGSSEAAARRAARLGDSFSPTTPIFLKPWRDEMIKLGKDPGPEPVTSADMPRPPSNFLHVARDTAKAWSVIGKHAVYESNSYAKWTADRGHSPYSPSDNPQELWDNGNYRVLTPAETVDLGKRIDSKGGGIFTFHPLMGGMPMEMGQESLELVAAEVMPHFR
ncbi:LLM class flavin-dependent oxidoreductase [Dehalococcoidia bacterium]|nr:LLM class flavin-dependent oxidoreductase [Dehalococcoidia bacterium]